MPEAYVTLYILGGFVSLWAITVLARGVRSVPGGARRGVVLRWRLIALGAIALVLGMGVCGSAEIVYWWVRDRQPRWNFWTNIAAGAVLAVGISTALVGAKFDPAKGRRRCGRCWYDMSATPGLVCPECGREAKSEALLLGTRPSRGWVSAGIAVMLAAGAIQRVASVKMYGWRGWIPLTAIIASFELLPTKVLEEGSRRPYDSLDRRLGTAWKWQQRWFESRVRTVQATEPSLGVVYGLEMMRGQSEWHQFPGACAAVCAGLASERPAERSQASELCMRLVSGNRGPFRPRATLAAQVRAHETSVLSAVGDADRAVRDAAYELIWLSPSALRKAIPAIVKRVSMDRAEFGPLTGEGIPARAILAHAAMTTDEGAAAFLHELENADGLGRVAMLRSCRDLNMGRGGVGAYCERMLLDPDAEVAALAADTLASTYPSPETVERITCQMLMREGNLSVFVRALCETDRRGKSTLRTLIRLLWSEDENTVSTVAMYLNPASGIIPEGELVIDAVPRLLELSHDSRLSQGTRDSARWAWQEIMRTAGY